ncbi:hypothetical protein AF332_11705 [Sporosarcina globispora]|uniref:Uncharacterized protein n=1 Tax=Sporosarcina globispora TaxID=1459 RepID=A0A0M0GBX8_SPOGL|nr:DUF3603 family protein [Sporosarcina globispora]KON87425.1 hypothetical protein AF332_11705 [Sporosarcina globispora]
MKYMHDVWVNFFEREENGYNVCEFHEWKKDDSVELMDQIPLLRVDSELYNYLLNSLQQIPQEILNLVRNKSYLRKNHERVRVEYGFIITDGFDVLAIETEGYDFPLKKSKLIPRQSRLALELAEVNDSVIKMPDSLSVNKEYNLLSPDPATMQGLTRKERSLKQLLFIGLCDLKESRNLDKLRYVYSEFNINNYSNVKEFDFDELFNALMEEVSDGWSESHNEFCKLITYGQIHLEKLYEIQSK